MVNYEFIGARIREARLRKKLSQEQLAAMVDVGTSHISHIETGATIPSTKLFRPSKITNSARKKTGY